MLPKINSAGAWEGLEVGELVKTSGPTGSPAGAGTLDPGSLSMKEREIARRLDESR